MNNKITIGELFNKSINNLKICYKEILILLCVVQLPFLIVTSGGNAAFNFYSFTHLDEDLRLLIIPVSIVIFIVSIIYYFAIMISNGAVIKILNEAEENNYITWKDGLKHSWENKANIILLNLFIGLFVFLGSLVLAVVALVITLLTCGAGLIIVIPVYILVIAVTTPIIYIYLSTMVIKNLGVMDSIRETNKIFTKENFNNIGLKLLISGGCYSLVPTVGIAFSFIPFLGPMIISIAGVLAQVFVMSWNNIIIKDEIRDYKYEESNF